MYFLQTVSWYGTAPRTGKHHHSHHKHSHHNHHAKAWRSHSSGNVLEENGKAPVIVAPSSGEISNKKKNLHKSHSDGELLGTVSNNLTIFFLATNILDRLF